MKLYEVVNGYKGYSDVHVLVIADSPRHALQLAEAQYRAQAADGSYEADYWTNLRCSELCGDVAQPWASPPRS